MENFIYETPTKVYFGRGEELKVGKIVKDYNPRKVLLHYGGKSAQESGLLDRVRKCLRDEGIYFVELGGVVANPELGLVRKGIELCRREGTHFEKNALGAPCPHIYSGDIGFPCIIIRIKDDHTVGNVDIASIIADRSEVVAHAAFETEQTCKYDFHTCNYTLCENRRVNIFF